MPEMGDLRMVDASLLVFGADRWYIGGSIDR